MSILHIPLFVTNDATCIMNVQVSLCNQVRVVPWVIHSMEREVQTCGKCQHGI